MPNGIKASAKASDESRRVPAALMNPHYSEWLQFLKESESWTAAQIAESQLEQLTDKHHRFGIRHADDMEVVTSCDDWKNLISNSS